MSMNPNKESAQRKTFKAPRKAAARNLTRIRELLILMRLAVLRASVIGD